MKNIVIGVTSSIAAYKIVELVIELKRDNKVAVIMTQNAANIIKPGEFEKLGVAVAIKTFKKSYDYKKYLKQKKIRHISLADNADIVVIAPATANIIGKIAYGIADDLLTTTVMATKAPVLICPSMNVNMWNNPIVQRNVKALQKLGYRFIEPEYGRLACGYKGVGRLADIKRIKDEIENILRYKNSLKGKKILVTAGATVEEIDMVRVITNKSSGKQGIYLAEEAYKRGADVTLLKGKTEIETNYPIKIVNFSSADNLSSLLNKEIKKNDVVIHAAAVSDFTIRKKINKKIESIKNESLILRLEKSKKIINRIKKINKKIKLVGFKAECNVSEKEIIEKAYKKLKEANCDLIVANDVGKNPFGSEMNNVFVVNRDKKIKQFKGEKREIANKILDLI
ncbi:bifunctional phosphopantothenoylcysteine decarboxylase/phosphopantothenate--cysteine ligase CoaBC [Candidatus Woesearchaeota archaeon]|nr:bifunctional phosphopantothenoylcysteine decarboxylase/phosphopantothenate--cysteine ligase CoaBC [Candidatus Woesearchaeota archaeon]